MKRFLYQLWLSCLGLCLIPSFSYAQKSDYPTRSVKVIVPFSAGSGADHASRFLGICWRSSWGKVFWLKTELALRVCWR